MLKMHNTAAISNNAETGLINATARAAYGCRFSSTTVAHNEQTGFYFEGKSWAVEIGKPFGNEFNSQRFSGKHYREKPKLKTDTGGAAG